MHEPPMEGPDVRFRVHADGLDSHRVARAGDTDRDLSAVRDEDSTEHGRGDAPPRIKTFSALEREITVLPRGAGVPLRAEGVEGPDQRRPGLRRFDHVVEVS